MAEKNAPAVPTVTPKHAVLSLVSFGRIHRGFHRAIDAHKLGK